ncbi:MAG: hypothetical protein ACD_16C00248G0012 [uncultured bacterium]|nr:MAG: hypothetical protein ACD_16C00248G0012 [uncultured bacterium]OFW68525.1 MAG: hypothetical protein A2X70_02250 [Alphaproteobacteria bacterium GWC2_42_16]OFW73142.1 MAG: hypothetical protein A2Z80_00905 [Alphaproteobacteria bacterium GWA2_41_27]OFW81690.1 MAG: hypothetical protein A3E50_01820 [Alphaproteobacteria bacterium RIFCSPHIGHO2_12_FULL_42_100]OFW86408.1 MAG: hypothetical protein A2W06_05740 [Alphaproteobacteria bacterium RBG_16_42_14]OFW90590.1 MAG: hypothetical protein A3C41_002
MDQNQRKITMLFGWFSKLSEHWILGTVFCLTGCMGVYEGGFECPPGKGMGCTSISEVNKTVDRSFNDPSLEIRNWSLENNKEPVPCDHCSPSSNNQSLMTNNQIWYAPWAFKPKQKYGLEI